jgi:HSP90 family molecular chaperone
MSANDPKLELQIDPRVVRQLGAELITDPEQALLELIKNSYDADADRCRVEIDTKATQEVPSPDGKSEILVGTISVQDDGPGTPLDDIKRKWLLISGSEKRPAEGKQKELTKKNRAPLGDKGIGRLGTMRLGDRISFVSRKKGSSADAKGVEFRWSQFGKAGTLGDVPVAEIAGKPKTGYSTLVKVEGLEEPERWRAADQSELQARISKLISPFTNSHPLAIEIEIDAKKIELQKLRQDLNLHATAH